ADFKAARVGGNNQGVRDGYRFVRRLTYDQRGAFLAQGFADVAKRGGSVDPNRFGRDDVITLAIALQPTFEALLEAARKQEEARQEFERRSQREVGNRI